MTVNFKRVSATNFLVSDDVPNEVENSSKTPRQAQPLPKEEVEDQEEKARVIAQILELQNTLEGI